MRFEAALAAAARLYGASSFCDVLLATSRGGGTGHVGAFWYSEARSYRPPCSGNERMMMMNYTLKKRPRRVPLANLASSARQHPENQKENRAGHSPERTVEGRTESGRREASVSPRGGGYQAKRAHATSGGQYGNTGCNIRGVCFGYSKHIRNKNDGLICYYLIT